MKKFIPTKNNLYRAKRLLSFAKKGYNLLDRKRNVLMRTLLSLIEEAKTVSSEIDELTIEAHKAVKYATISNGLLAVEELAEAVKLLPSVKLRYVSNMGVETPRISYEEQEQKFFYGMYRSNMAMDVAINKSSELRKKIFKYAQIQQGIYSISIEIRKIQKKANSIEKIQIPRFEDIVKEIEDSLEAREREDLFRLKMTKKKLSSSKRL